MKEVDVTIAGRRVDVTEPMERHIRQHIDRLPRFDGKIQYLTVTLAVDAGDQLVEIIAKCHRADLVAEAQSHDMYQSIDEAFGKMERQISRHHDKMVHNPARAAQRAAETEKRPD
jgi:putative sigma-54 modulation protein